MKSTNIKLNIKDNIENDFGHKDEYIEIPLSRLHIDAKVFLEMIKFGLNKVLPLFKNQSFFLNRTKQIKPNLKVNAVRFFYFSLYDTLLKNRQTVNKTIDKLLPLKLKEISQILDNYEWNVHVEYKRGFRGDNLLLFMKEMNNDYVERLNNIYTIVSIQSVKYPSMKGELIFDEFMCLYDKSNNVEINAGKRIGTLNLFHNHSEYALNFRDLKNEKSKLKLLIDTDKKSENTDIDMLLNNFNQFIGRYSQCYKPLEGFKLLIEASDCLKWRIYYSEQSGNVFNAKREYFAEKSFSIKENNDDNILRAIISMMKYISGFKCNFNNDFMLNYEIIDDIINERLLEENEIEQLFETLSLLKY